MLIYNTLTRKKEEFRPIDPPNVKMYVCGPTVYDYFHIGNARSFVMADILRKYLIYKGYQVTFAMNLTDVDDKIIKKSIEQKKDSGEIAEHYINSFFEDIDRLKIKRADIYPKATGHMDDIVAMIKKLEEKGIAYNVKGNVFYDVSKFPGYGKLSGKKTDELESGARIEINDEKKNPLDFSLWKSAKEGEPYWQSPWGNGRPGWHIECSAMSCRHLGDNFDIHAGGNDLIFPHHENEIAQSEGANSRKFVNYWIHFGFLNINEEKMSKSLGNFFTARDVLDKYPAEALRLLYAQAHYGGPLNFTEELLAGANKGLEKLINLGGRIEQELKSSDGVDNPGLDYGKYFKAFETAMDDDFNTPQAVAVIFDFAKEVNRVIAENENIGREFYSGVKDFLIKTASDVLGIVDFTSLKSESNGKLEGELIELLIKIRQDAKKDKNFRLADSIRDELKELGIQLQDSKDKTTYKISG